MATIGDPALDLSISRVLKAPRAAVWNAWVDPALFQRWWLPAPAHLRVVAFDATPGGPLVTEMSDDGAAWAPHLSGCFLEVVEEERLVWTTALLSGWRPSPQPFITGVFTFADHPDGTLYTATALHKDEADRAMHEELGFSEGWNLVTDQLAALVE